MNKDYYTRLTFKGIGCEIRLIPHGDGFDIELASKQRISGEYFQALRKYLEVEGYFETAREWCGLDITE
jgi:hypothetical protein